MMGNGSISRASAILAATMVAGQPRYSTNNLPTALVRLLLNLTQGPRDCRNAHPQRLTQQRPAAAARPAGARARHGTPVSSQTLQTRLPHEL